MAQKTSPRPEASTLRAQAAHRATYPWLQSPIDSEEWVVSDGSPTGKATINFDVLFPDHSKLTEVHHAHLLRTIKTLLINVRTGEFATIESASAHREMAAALFVLVRWMVGRSIYRFDRLTRADFEEYCAAVSWGVPTLLNYRSVIRDAAARIDDAALPLRRCGRLNRRAFLELCGLEDLADSTVRYELSRVAAAKGLYLDPTDRARLASGPPKGKPILVSSWLRRLINVWDHLYSHGEVLGADRIIFDPFPSGSRVLIASSGAGEGERTPNIPVEQALTLIDCSIQWVMNFSEDLLRLRDDVLAADVDHMRPGAQRSALDVADRLRHYISSHEGCGTIPVKLGRFQTGAIAKAIGTSVNVLNSNTQCVSQIRELRTRLNLLSVSERLDIYIQKGEENDAIPMRNGLIDITAIARDINCAAPSLYSDRVCRELLRALRVRIGIEEGDGRPSLRGTPSDHPEALLTLRQAAGVTGFSIPHLRGLVYKGAIPLAGTSDGKQLVRRRDLWSKPPRSAKSLGTEASLQTVFRDVLSAFRPTSSGQGAPWPLQPKFTRFGSQKDDEVDVNTAVNVYLPAACMIVICAFSARRHDEAMSLIRGEGINDIVTGGYGERWLRIWIEKTVKSWDRIPIPEVVVLAVRVLTLWSEPAATRSGKPDLFQYPSWRDSSVAHQFRAADALRDFGQFVGLAYDSPLTDWRLAPHQLRRLFAVMYFWRYEYGNLASLAWMLRHFNIERTRHYVTEAERGTTMSQMSEYHTRTVLTAIARGERAAGGGFTERLKTMITRMTAKVQIAPPDRMERRVAEWVRRTGVRLKPLPWGYCACGSTQEQTSKAKCRVGQDASTVRGPDDSVAKPAVCAGCPFNCTGPEFAEVWRSEVQQLTAVANDPTNPPILRNVSLVQLDTIKRYAREAVYLELGLADK